MDLFLVGDDCPSLVLVRLENVHRNDQVQVIIATVMESVSIKFFFHYTL